MAMVTEYAKGSGLVRSRISLLLIEGITKLGGRHARTRATYHLDPRWRRHPGALFCRRADSFLSGFPPNLQFRW